MRRKPYTWHKSGKRQVMVHMNYITLINSFWDAATTNPLSTGQVSLYFALLHVCNRSNWTEWFQAPNQVLSVLTGLSRSGILKARNELKQRGLIDFRERGTKATIYKLSTLSTLSTTMSNSTQVGVQDSTQKGVQNSNQNSTQKGAQKSGTKERYRIRQDKKSISNEIQEKCAQKSVPEDVAEALEDFCMFRETMGMPVVGNAVGLFLERLEELAPGDHAAWVLLLKQAARRGWKDIYPLKGEQPGEEQKSIQNRFHNFEQRDTDYNAMVMDRLKERLGVETSE